MVQEARWRIPEALACGVHAKQIAATPIKRVHIGGVPFAHESNNLRPTKFLRAERIVIDAEQYFSGLAIAHLL
jgi:hypothetical protein